MTSNSISGNHDGLQSYLDREMSFSLDAPSGWLLDNSGQQGSRVIFSHSVQQGEFRPNVSVVVQPLSPLTEDEYLTLSRLQAKRFSGTGRFDVDEPAYQAGRVMEWTSVQIAPFPLRFRQLILVTNGSAYVVTATATIEQFDSYRDGFESILSSFRLLNCPQANT